MAAADSHEVWLTFRCGTAACPLPAECEFAPNATYEDVVAAYCHPGPVRARTPASYQLWSTASVLAPRRKALTVHACLASGSAGRSAGRAPFAGRARQRADAGDEALCDRGGDQQSPRQALPWVVARVDGSRPSRAGAARCIACRACAEAGARGRRAGQQRQRWRRGARRESAGCARPGCAESTSARASAF